MVGLGYEKRYSPPPSSLLSKGLRPLLTVQTTADKQNIIEAI